LAQAILMESFPPRKRGVANAVYGMGVVVAPIIGPTLGGWITDSYSWRWIFFINMPVGALALFMCNSVVEDPPYIRAHARHHGKLRVDMIGFFLLALWLATLQIVLDKGQEDDWLAAPWIRWTLFVTTISFVGFVLWELRVKHPLVDLRILKNRNFAVGVVMIALLGMVLYSTLAMLPLYLQSLMGYTAMDSGMAISPRGFGAVLSMILVSQLITRVDARLLICVGFGILAYASSLLANINTQIAMSDIVVPNVIMGLAMGLIFVPLTTLCVGDLSNEQMGNATGIYNLMRNIGGSFGIALITTMLARREQVNQAALCVHMSVFDPAFRLDYQKATATFSALRGNAVGAQAALTSLYGTLVSQATLCAYVDCFRFLAGLSLLCIAGAFFFKRLRHAGHSASVH
jgi:DHA2 family multidrug resistance protein